jgi:phage terminase small subunit
MALTAKQQAFINEYVKDFNATQAAIRAGYSEKSARSQGQRLLTNADISEEIARRIEEQTMTADEVLIRLGDMARGDMGDFVKIEPGGQVFSLDLERAKREGKLHLIKKLKYNAQGFPEIELYDAQSALQLIGKHYGLFKDVSENKTEVDFSDDARDILLSRINRMATRGSTDEGD